MVRMIASGCGVMMLCVNDVTVRQCAGDDEPCNSVDLHALPQKHDIISCLAVGARWITSTPLLQVVDFYTSVSCTVIHVGLRLRTCVQVTIIYNVVSVFWRHSVFLMCNIEGKDLEAQPASTTLVRYHGTLRHLTVL